jgi:hypothetical protein
MRRIYTAGGFAVLVGLAAWAWIDAFTVSVHSVQHEQWAAPTVLDPGFKYRHFDVTLTNGTVAHVTATHYIRDGASLQLKDGATDTIVYSTERAESVAEVKP